MFRLKEPLYKSDQTIIKQYGFGEDKKIKVITMKSLRTAGLEVDDKKVNTRCSVNEAKLSNNISRARTHIYELACCNEWDYFITLTLDSTKYDRTDLEKYHKSFTIFLRDYGKKYGIKIKILLVPELHSDGKSWHLHGLINGLPESHLHRFKIGDTMGKNIAEKVKKGDTVYKWEAYENRYGWCVFEPIKNHEAICKYITKYINKDLERSVTELNAHLYYHSRGLKKSKEIMRGRLLTPLKYDFVNEYCKIKTLPYSQEAIAFFDNCILKN